MKRRLIAVSVFLLTLGLLYAAFQYFVSLEQLIAYENRLRELVNRFPAISLVSGLIVYIAMSLIPGTGGKAFVAGWLFGFWGGLLIVNVGLTIAAIITFFAVRYLFQDLVHQRFPRLIHRVDQALRKDGPFYLLTVRLLHAPYTLTNYVSGATTVEARTFWWTTQLGLLPGSVVFALAGSQLPTLKELVTRHPLQLVSLPLLVAVSLLALLPIGFRWLLRRYASVRDFDAADAERSSSSPRGRSDG